MYQNQKTHPIYEIKVDNSNVSRIFEYYMLLPKIQKDDKVLDVGCNSGIGMDILSTKSDNVFGIDVVPELKEILDSKYANNTKIKYKIVEEGEIGFHQKFDWIVASNFIEHVPNPQFYLALFKGALNPGGVLVLTTVNRVQRLFPWQKPFNQHHFTEYDVRSLRKMIRKYFAELRITGIIKKEPFYPNTSKRRRRRKFEYGIKLPLKLFLMNLKKGKLSFKNLTNKELKHSQKPEGINHEESFILDDFIPFFKYIEESSENKAYWSEIVCYCINH